MPSMRVTMLFLSMLFLVTISSASADDFTSTDYQVLAPVLQPAGYGASSDFQLWGTISEPAVGVSSAASFELGGGFLQFRSVPAISGGSGGGGNGGGGGGGSSNTPFVFGAPPALIQIPSLTLAAPPGADASDFNGDGRVDIVDFSIMYYWYGRKSPPLRVDLNRDGVVDIYDFSIMAYYWTI